MSRRAPLLAFALLVPVALHAQSDEALLQRRLANLTARRAQLMAAAAARDTATWRAERFLPVGKDPLVVLVPGWAEPAAAPLVAAVVDSWTVRTGLVFTATPPETIRVAVRGDTAGWSRPQIARLLEEFPVAVLGAAREEVQRRIGRRLGNRLVSWPGGGLMLTNSLSARRGAILALSRDTTGAGPRCLEGEVRDCLTVLADDAPRIQPVRRSLFAFTLDRAGPTGWGILARDTLGTPEARIGQVDGHGYAAAVEAWLQDIRSPQRRGFGDPWLVPLAVVWSVGFLALFLWRLRWHHA